MDKPVIEKNMRAYCGIRKADRWSATPEPLYTCVKNTCVVAVGRHERNMQTNWRTLSSLLIIPPFTRPLTINTPSTGIIASLPMANEEMAPSGSVLQMLLGIFNLASADPKQIRPSGTEAAPINVAASITNASGG